MSFLQNLTPSSGFERTYEGAKDVDTVSASFEPSYVPENPLEGVEFCRKAISASWANIVY
jgi:hypothetical protein